MKSDKEVFIHRLSAPHLSVRDLAEAAGMSTIEYKNSMVRYVTKTYGPIPINHGEVTLCYFCDHRHNCNVYFWSLAFDSGLEFLNKCQSFTLDKFTKIL